MKSRSKKGEFKKAVKDANKKIRNSASLLGADEAARLLFLGTPEGPVQIHSAKFSELAEPTKAWVSDLWRRNMETLMRGSHWGFDPANKAEELGAATSRYLVARASEEEGGPLIDIAYCHYRYDMDEGSPVVYCYETQTEPDWQSRGLGARFLLLLHIFAQRTHMEKIVATVLLANGGSAAFFRRHGYSEDESNPDDADFVILSKAADGKIELPDPIKSVRFAQLSLGEDE